MRAHSGAPEHAGVGVDHVRERSVDATWQVSAPLVRVGA
jgi:hypothetical protein